MQEQVGRRIRELRQARSLTQEAVAERAKVNGKYFGAIERGEVNVNLATMVRIADALQVPPADLLVQGDRPARSDGEVVEQLVQSVVQQGDADRIARLRTFLERVFR